MTDNDDRNADVAPDDQDTARQEHPHSSPTTKDQDIANDDATKVLPGTGGPDDPGDVDVDDEDFDLPTG